jgi:ornithine decarboxylase
VDTPFLVLDLAVVRDAYRAWRAALPGVEMHYAMKCQGHPAVLRTLRGQGCGFEISSTTELADLVAIGVNPTDVLYSNPVKPIHHIALTHAAGVRQFAFDSHDELDKLATVARGALVYVRLTATGLDSVVPSEGKFGVDQDQAVDLLLAARDKGLVPYGVAFHVGSQMLNPPAWAPPLEAVGGIMAKLKAENIILDMVNIGGGFPAHYDVAPPSRSWYRQVITDGVEALPYPVRVVAEPGRALVAQAGTLHTTVIGTAVRGRRKWVHLDVGAFNGLLEVLETGNRLRYPVTDSRRSAKQERCHLTGPTCDSQDTIMFDVPLSVGLRTGDRVSIGCTGAYTTVYALTFNGFGPPEVVAAGRGH